MARRFGEGGQDCLDCRAVGNAPGGDRLASAATQLEAAQGGIKRR